MWDIYVGWKACNRLNRFPSSNLGRSAKKRLKVNS